MILFLSLDGDGGDPADAEERRGSEERVHGEVDAIEVVPHGIPENRKPSFSHGELPSGKAIDYLNV